mmetsp:Transcript_10469/g.33111  ORF Transcript_10469/g.33111 Transcript_10469/m.33111 type:complete len:235 (+) Transcript_10469:1737-2441(+)
MVPDDQAVRADTVPHLQVGTAQRRLQVGVVRVDLGAVGLLGRWREAHTGTALGVQVLCPRQAGVPSGTEELKGERVRVRRQPLDRVGALLAVVGLPQLRRGALQTLCAVEVGTHLLPGPAPPPGVEGLRVVTQVEGQGHEGAAAEHARRARARELCGEVRDGLIARLLDARPEAVVRREVPVDDELVREQDRSAVGLRRCISDVEQQDRVLSGRRQPVGQDGASQSAAHNHEVV